MTGRRTYYALKRRLMRAGCLLGRHNFKMGVAANGGGGFGCLWCNRPAATWRPRQSRNATVTHLTGQADNGLRDAERHVRWLFGGKP